MDKNLNKGWGIRDGDFITHKRDEFLRVANNPENFDAVVVVDEGGEDIGRHAGDMGWLSTRGRHKGFQCFFIAQRANQIDRNVRTQCINVFAFRIGQGDADLMAEEYSEPLFKEAARLKQYEFVGMIGFNDAKKMRLTQE